MIFKDNAAAICIVKFRKFATRINFFYHDPLIMTHNEQLEKITEGMIC